MSRIRTMSWSLPGSDGQPILGETHLPPVPLATPETMGSATAARGVLLIAHGFKGYKDYGFFPALADAAAEAGLIAHRFNFSHSGMTERTATFERPELFERDTWGRQIEDLATVAHAAAHGDLAGSGQSLGQVWFGHSRGGVTTLLTAARVFAPSFGGSYDQWPNQPPAPVGIVTAAAPDAAVSLDEDQRRIVREQGYLVSPSSRTGQDLRVGRAWLEEVEGMPDAFDVQAAAATLRCPLLILHGDEDRTVPVSAARNLAQAAGDRATLHIISGAGHTFNARNPLPGDEAYPEALTTMIERTTRVALECL